MELPLSTVATAKLPKQDREVRARWAWTEPSVWTDRMLTALEKGVKGDVWFSLMDKVYARRNLERPAFNVSVPRHIVYSDWSLTCRSSA